MEMDYERKKQVKMTEKCPFCGKVLCADNAVIDYIVPMSMGGTCTIENLRYLCRECNIRKGDKYDALFEYYVRLMNAKGLSDETTSKRVDYFLRNMSENDMILMIEQVKNRDATSRRLAHYAKAFSKMQNEARREMSEPSSDELAEMMNGILRSYDNYDIESELREEISGNIFIFQQDFPIEQYRDVLATYGEEKQGEIYSIYLDEDGRLVVY